MSSEKVENLLTQGKALVESGQYEKAITLFEEALRLEENNVELLRECGQAYAKSKQFPKAFELFDKALKIDPNNSDILRNYGNALLKKQKYDQAIIYFKKAIEIEPNNVKTICSYANVLMKLERIEESLPLWQKAIKIEPDNVITISSYANALMKLERIKESLPFWQKAIKIEPDNVITIRSYANALMKSGKIEESLSYFQKAMELEPQNLTIIKMMTNCANNLMIIEKFEESLPFWEEITKRDFDNIYAKNSRANALMKAKKFEDCVNYLEPILKSEPNNAIGMRICANALVELTQWEESIDYWEKALQLENNEYDKAQTLARYANVLMNLYKIEGSLSDLEKAEQLLQESLNIEPNNPETLASYANVLVISGKKKDSLPYWKQSLEIEPKNKETFINFTNTLVELIGIDESEAYFSCIENILQYLENTLNIELDNAIILGCYINLVIKLGKIEKSLPLLERYLESSINDEVDLCIYANTLVKNGYFEEAFLVYEKAIQLNPNDVITLTQYGNALFDYGNYDKAFEQLEKSLKIESDNWITLTTYADKLSYFGNYSQSFQLYEKALKIKPDDIITLTSYAKALSKEKFYPKAIALLEKALSIKDDDLMTWQQYIETLSRKGDYNKCVEKCLTLLDSYPNDVNILRKIAVIYVNSKKYEEACQFFDRAENLETNNYVILSNDQQWDNYNYTLFKHAIALEGATEYLKAIAKLEKIDLTCLWTYDANVIRITLGRLYYCIKQQGKGNQYFEQAIANSDDKEPTWLYSARSIFATSPYNETAVNFLSEIAENSPRYAEAMEMLTINLSGEEFFNKFDSQSSVDDTNMLNRAMYHKIANEISILKSIAYWILPNVEEEYPMINTIIEDLEYIVKEIHQRREKQEKEIDQIPQDNYKEILLIIKKTAHDIADFVNNELAVIVSNIRFEMDQADTKSQYYLQFEQLLTQLTITQSALNDLKAINEGIRIKYSRFQVKKIFEKWQLNPKIDNAEIELEILNADTYFYGDEEKIKSALNEMVENSLKHNQDQENLIIKMKAQDIINPEGIRGLTIPGEQKYLLIEFSDNGIGIPENKKDWIFQPLTTTSPKGQGSGLGLYIIRRTLTQMQGYIKETGENGVQFKMYIPYYQD